MTATESRLLQGKQGVYCLSLTVGIILYSIITPISYTVLPNIIKELHGESYYAWIAAVFALGSFIGACLLSTVLRFASAHIAYSLSLPVFAFCTLACAYASSLSFLLIARLVQGLSGGLVVALTYNMLNTSLPPRLLPRGIGLISGMWGLGTLIGPYLGGRFENWRIPFFAVSLVTLIFCVAICIIFKKFAQPQVQDKRHDARQTPLLPISILAAFVVIVGLGGTPELVQHCLNAYTPWLGITGNIVITPFVSHAGALFLSFLLFIILVITEKHSRNKLFPEQTFSFGSIFFIIYLIVILNMVALGATKLYLPLFLQNLHQAGKIVSGYIAFTDSIGWSLGALAGAGISAFAINTRSDTEKKQACLKTYFQGSGIIFVIAPLCCIIGMAVMFLLMPIISSSFGVLFAIGTAFFITGFCSGIFWPHILAKIMQSADLKDKEAADSSIVTVQLFAAALADCVAGTVVNSTNFTTENIASVSYAAEILFGFCLCLLIIVFLLCLKIKNSAVT